jgi:hypothetical protein
MGLTRVFIGIDSETGMGLAVESAGPDIFFLTLTAGDRSQELCKFLCPRELLVGVLRDTPLEIKGKAGTCRAEEHVGRVTITVQRAEDTEPSFFTLSSDAYERTINLVGAKAFLR